MAHHFRRPNGYWITRYKYDLFDYYRLHGTKPAPLDPRLAHPENNDVILLYNDKYEIVGQRNILSEGCDYFNIMLCGNFKEATQTRIPIQNDYISFKAFDKMIDYIHTKNITLSKDQIRMILEILDLCELYLFDELKTILVKFLYDSIDEDTLVYIAAAAHQFNLDDLKAKCLEFNYQLMDLMEPLARPLGICAFPGHEDHHYLKCQSKIYYRP